MKVGVVGAIVGLAVGCADGFLVGPADGLLVVGLKEGVKVEGVRVGAAVG